MRNSAAVAVIWIAATGAALAQQASPQTERVTVTGTKSREVITRFVETFSAPTRITGKIARWQKPACPITVGIRPEFAAFISRRVRELAAQVDAPVNKDAGCRPNIEIVFTTTPQALMDNVRTKHEAYLGYADNHAQRKKLATFTRPIQAWYLTTTSDVAGKTVVDGSRAAGASEVRVPCFEASRCQGGSQPIESLSPVHAFLTRGAHLGDGLRSGFYHVIIVADPNQLVDQEMSTLADYIAMLALTQLSSLDVCQKLDSITSLLTPGCDSKAAALTVNDLGYLRGLYHMNAESKLRSQEEEIVYRISQETQNGQ